MKVVVSKLWLCGWLALLWAGDSRAEELSRLTVLFRHAIDGNPLHLDSLRYKNASQETYSVERLSYLLSGFVLESETGERHSLDDQYAWIDLARRRVSLDLAQIPKGRYRSLTFQIGIDPKTNHDETAAFPATHPLNPNLNGLHWSWQGGYIFLALEGKWRASEKTLSGFAYHLARNPNRTQIVLSGDFNLSKDLLTN